MVKKGIKRDKWMYSFVWEKGNMKKTNEDTIFIRSMHTSNGEVIMACVCDGMGGMEVGENASGYVAWELEKWMVNELIPGLSNKCSDGAIKNKGIRIFQHINKELFQFMRTKNILTGTTASIIICYRNKYYCFHIGDSRIYKLSAAVRILPTKMKQLTRDHICENGAISRCIGLNQYGKPDFYTGRINNRQKTGFLLCTDGFYHMLQEERMKKILNPLRLSNERIIKRRLSEVTKRLIMKGETDNISAIYILIKEG